MAWASQFSGTAVPWPKGTTYPATSTAETVVRSRGVRKVVLQFLPPPEALPARRAIPWLSRR